MKEKAKKFVASVCLGAVALTSVPAVAMATAVEPVTNLSIATPYMTYIVGAGCKLSISGTTATVNASVDGDSTDATKAEVIAELQVKNGNDWDTITTWRDTRDGNHASVYKTKTISKGNTYRVKATVTVWEGSLSETRVLYGY